MTRRFAGANAYWLALDDNLRPQGVASLPPMKAVVDTLDALRAMHGTLLRVHTLGISYGDAEGNGTPTLMPRPGVYNEAMFVQIDRIIAEAGRRGIWLVAPMADRWNYYHGGGVTFAKMVLGPGATLSDFYGNGSVRSAFKAYLSTWLNRVNSVTGVRYKDDPTVAVVELGNEMYDAPAAWTSEMAAFVKSVAPDVLVADPTAATGKYVTDSNVALWDRKRRHLRRPLLPSRPLASGVRRQRRASSRQGLHAGRVRLDDRAAGRGPDLGGQRLTRPVALADRDHSCGQHHGVVVAARAGCGPAPRRVRALRPDLERRAVVRVRRLVAAPAEGQRRRLLTPPSHTPGDGCGLHAHVQATSG